MRTCGRAVRLVPPSTHWYSYFMYFYLYMQVYCLLQSNCEFFPDYKQHTMNLLSRSVRLLFSGTATCHQMLHSLVETAPVCGVLCSESLNMSTHLSMQQCQQFTHSQPTHSASLNYVNPNSFSAAIPHSMSCAYGGGTTSLLLMLTNTLPEEVNCSSVLKKRRKKMRQHKYKKWLKLTRIKRRNLRNKKKK